MRTLCLFGVLLMGLAGSAAELDWKPLEGTERAAVATSEATLASAFTSWWFGLFPSAVIDFPSERSGLFLLLK